MLQLILTPLQSGRCKQLAAQSCRTPSFQVLALADISSSGQSSGLHAARSRPCEWDAPLRARQQGWIHMPVSLSLCRADGLRCLCLRAEQGLASREAFFLWKGRRAQMADPFPQHLILSCFLNRTKLDVIWSRVHPLGSKVLGRLDWRAC